MNDRVREQSSFPRDFRPVEFSAVAVVTNGSWWQVDFSAFDAFASHQFALRHEPVELLYSERSVFVHLVASAVNVHSGCGSGAAHVVR